MMRRYPAYRDSGVEWLGEVPEGWEVRRLKEICRVFPSNVDKHTAEDETPVSLCNYTDVYYRDVITRDLDFMRASATDEQIKKFYLKEGDVLFTKDSETADDIGISALVKETMVDVLCGYHLSIARPKPGTSGAFVKRCLDSASAKAHFAVTANGLTRVGLGQAAVGSLALPFPPLAEQTAIAAFLDRETAKIDALVDEQRRLIALLREKRQAVISHAVTKGLNPAAPMKPSGVDWVGNVPEGWKVIKLGGVCRLQGGYAFPSSEFCQEGIPIIKMNNLDRGRVKLQDRVCIPEELALERVALNVGDLVWGMSGSIGETGSLGNFARILEADVPSQLNQRVGRFMPKSDACSVDFLEILIQARYFREQVLLWVTGTAQFNISSEQVESCKIALPPVEEQLRVVAYLKTKLRDFKRLTAAAEAAITLLQERRAALISAAVTGKIDVRDLASAQTEAA